MEENNMNLIDRYLHEVSRYIPPRKRGDILAELQSLLVDTLEDRFGKEPSETEVEELLKEFGRPKDVAASYHPQGQYLVGPALYPLFRMVATIVIAAVLGAQALAWGISAFVAEGGFSVLEMIGSIFNSIPSALGWVVLVFVILQYFDAKPHLDEEPWEPKALPEINPDQDIKRGELIVGLVFSVLVLVLISLFPQWVGFITTPGGKFYPNPVIIRYLTLIQISLACWIGFNIYLLWKGRQDLITRLMTIILNIYSVVVLTLLVIGHNVWLAARSSGGYLDAIEAISTTVDGGWELVGMHAFRLAFVVALIVTVIEIIGGIYRLVRSRMRSDFSPKDFVLKVE
jgi:hypothetical protein